jgi:NAD(P)H-flavin reductase
MDPMVPRPYGVQRVRRDTQDTFTLELTPTDEGDDLVFAPGQFTMLYVFGVGEVPISISGDPSRPQGLVHTVRAVGTVTRALQQLKRGDIVGVRGPFGSPWPTTEAAGSDVVIVAGGIGLAPLRPVLLQILTRRNTYGRIILLYGARTPQDLLYPGELERWRGRFDLEVTVTVDRATAAWHGHVGVVTTFIAKASFDPSSTVVMICGPEVMMRFTVLELQKRGVSTENIFVSMERNMKCAIGFCGHCQLGPTFICKDGPVFRYSLLQPWFGKREV